MISQGSPRLIISYQPYHIAVGILYDSISPRRNFRYSTGQFNEQNDIVDEDFYTGIGAQTTIIYFKQFMRFTNGGVTSPGFKFISGHGCLSNFLEGKLIHFSVVMCLAGLKINFLLELIFVNSWFAVNRIRFIFHA